MSKTNKMSLGQLTLVTAVNMIGAGIIMLPSQLAQVGAVSVFAWIISTVGAMSLAYAFAKCGLYSKEGGGLGGYAEYSFGKSGNHRLCGRIYGHSAQSGNDGGFHHSSSMDLHGW